MSPRLIHAALLPALASIMLAGLAAAQPGSPPPAYSPPPETARLLEGPDLAKAQTYCLACHSADYVTTQPRGMSAAFWEAEVAKMRTAYGATIPDDAVKPLVNYLTTAYSAPAAHERETVARLRKSP
ncbi:cytochrome c [Phenylobacterium sp.]|jgi:sulfite dehydrogenase (cytochrome) subunit B|uniref:SorB family sulfite dehydrogenase c-type cytochrome subunit n=1 Tax=Phenylobacterium sp. TaxID=1871053 RepID=UPI0011F5F17F|nr:cytochrome c [Phenylobacterium sp.]THD70838.1 MAG: cytochrome c [Phenylobacterium sp.]